MTSHQTAPTTLVTLRQHIRVLLLCSAIVATVGTLGAQQTAVSTRAEDAPLDVVVPVDPQITTGTLPNGLRYYIRANRQPQGRAELRLVVNAGSVLEDDDQRGLAHFVEHMAFNGTLHFPQLDVVNFMQSLGMRFGAHVNAHTSFDETVYELQIPTNNPAVIDASMLIFEDFARNVTFDPVEVDKERGVILEEWRLGLGADARMQDAQFPILLKGSRYAERLPIGRPEIIQKVTYDRLKAFYTDWYRPDLMAVVVVGDVDPAAVETTIKRHFEPIPRPVSPKLRPVFTVPDAPATTFLVQTDPEATNTRISVLGKMAARRFITLGDYRRSIVERLFAGMLNERLDEIAESPSAPFLRAQTGRELFLRAEELTTLAALVPPGGVERGLGALFTELDRIARFGFTATELDRQKRSSQLYLQVGVTEKEKTPSEPLADEYVRNFMHAEPIPGIVYEYALSQRFTPGITLDEVNAVAKEWLPDRDRLVVVSAPEKDRASLPGEERLASIIRGGAGAPLTAYVDKVSTQPLMAALPSPGSIAKTSTNDALGVTEWQLSNGIRVVLKPTTFKQDEILFRAVSPGGTSLASDADFISAEIASQAIAEGGLGPHRRIDLDRMLAGRTVAVRADIGLTDEGLSGGAARADLETMFQLVHLTFTAPRADPVAFGVLTDRLKVALANQDLMPQTLFDRALTAALTQDHPRARPLTAAQVGQMSLDKALAFYKDRFADASDFLFVFVGSFDLDTMKPLIERYLASLPATRRNETWRDVGIRPPTGIVERQVRAGIEPRSEVSIVFTGAFQNDELHRVAARSMGEMLSGNLQRRLREDLGGTYGVSVNTSFTKRPTDGYRITIEFACDPARTDALVAAAFQAIDQFKLTGPTAGQVADGRRALLRDFETNSAQNPYFLNSLLFKYQYGEDVAPLFDMRPIYDQLTPAMIRDAAATYLDTKRYVKVTLLPDAK